MTLANWLPNEFFIGNEHIDDGVSKYLGWSVLLDSKDAYEIPIPSNKLRHKNIYSWCLIVKNVNKKISVKLIGWNKNPSKGWSFPVYHNIKYIPV